MAKTRSQTRTTTVKKEQEDCKDILVLHSVRTTPRNKITKRRVNHLSSDPKVKIEECNDHKSLLQASLEGSRDVKYQQTSQKQKGQFVDVVVNHSMSKSEDTIALLVQQHKSRKEFKTQEQVSNLISYIVDGNMSVLQASVKANMSYFSAQNYYNKYMKDPNDHIPKPYTMNRECTQDQIHKMINYIVDDKLSLESACRKVNMARSSGQRYYQKYLDGPNHAIPLSQSTSLPICTQEKINNLIYNIVDSKMTIAAAANKAKMSEYSGRRYYNKYMDDPSRIPSPNVLPAAYVPPFTQVEIKELIGYIVDDNMSVTAASKKANMSYKTGLKYYRQYLEDPKHCIPNPLHGKYNYTQKNIQELINYIVNDNMSVQAASKKTNVSYDIGKKYYRAYKNYIQHV